ncbi:MULTISPECIES: methionine--tRNA ligase subunit beta [Acidobacteriaceae]|uniref:methionine--tRNA ligase subunit beta n=1 Tax=Acidobacteriaceae TaxID=204434 RepID=UPI0020B1341A|nr:MULTISPECIES: methionine--tRNA ligase subunit beta [Acidobacteriaceae]MDW5265340.1 methionine--tRNA ligase subunit beta [Edaphobacter sp.]
MAPIMSEAQKKFYLTTPIYYVNARPHIGHAYTTIAADVIARRHRLLGDDTFFLTGTDEHGQKIERSATAAGIPPQQFADQVSAQFESLWKRMGITNDDYIRTTEPRHKRGVQKLFQLLRDRDKIYLSTYTGQYSVGEEMFIDGPPGTIGPDGKPTETVTEENYFFRLSEYQRPLIDLIESGELNIQPEVRKNEVLSFLRGNVNQATEQSTKPGAPGLDSQTWDGPLQNSPTPTIAHSAKGTPYVPGALKDLSISRSSFKWGIPVPGDEKHVIYVWLDALANYMTAIGYGSDDHADQENFKKYWPADLHLVGKEIIRFHCVYWPAFLLAAGLPLPKAITAHGWLLFEESKMSKSRGNIVRTETILDAFGTLKPDVPKAEQDLFAADVIRYFLLREIPFGQDGSFSFDALVQRYNSDLANGYGNLVSRTLAMIGKYFDGIVPDPTEVTIDITSSALGGAVGTQRTYIVPNEPSAAGSEFATDLQNAWQAIASADNYITSNAPWKLAAIPEQKQQLAAVLYTAAESIRFITALLYPILPYATSKVWTQLGLGSIEEAARNGELKNLQWGGLKPGTKLGPLSPIFPRAPKELIETMTDMELSNAAPKPAEPAGLPHVNLEVDNPAHTHTEFRESPISSESATPSMNPIAESTHPAAAPRTSALEEHNPGAKVGGSHAVTTERVTTSHTEAAASGVFANAAAASSIPDTPQIAIDDFVKIDLRVAKIIVAERIPKADKLLRLEVDLGYEKRQILSGIAQWYTPEELIGRNIVVIANLAPRKMRGLESHGMLLAASHGEDGKPVLATFGEDIALGSRLK